MKVKVSELTGAALDWVVAKIEGTPRAYLLPTDFPEYYREGRFNYSTNWAEGGPIIEREHIQLHWMWNYDEPEWLAQANVQRPVMTERHGVTALIAAMRCYVASKLGEQVDIPDELL